MSDGLLALIAVGVLFVLGLIVFGIALVVTKFKQMNKILEE